MIARNYSLAAAAALLCAGVTGFAGCNSDVTTSIYVEVFNGVGAPAPTQAAIQIYAPATLGVPAMLLGSKMADVTPGVTGPLGSLVILTGSRTGALHLQAQGLLSGQAVSQAEADVVIAANKQITATLTLATIGGQPDAGGTDAGVDAPVDGVPDAGGEDTLDMDAAVDRPTGDAGAGTRCVAHGECVSGYCVDGVCCTTQCNGVCQTCAPTGVCAPAAVDTDPRNECDDKGVNLCKTDGMCDGLGACRLYAAGKACAGAAACVAGNGGVATGFACDGAGTCASTMQTDCKGFLCANAACGTSCSSDLQCVASAFCSAGTCVRRPSNLAGNGDLEYATSNGWAFFAGGALSLSNTMSAGFAHAGQYSTFVSGRSVFYQGPSYALPTGPGKYTISVWGMQNQNPTLSGTVSVALTCTTGQNFLVVGTFGEAMAMGNWTNFAGTIDTSLIPDCVATSTPPGVMKSVVLYLNQTQMMGGTPVAFPDLYLDDLVVQVTDGHNLVGNSNFEAGVIDGWGLTGVGTLSVSTTVAKGGTHSLSLAGRSLSTVGPKYSLPIGAGKYTVTFNALHSGTKPHSLSLISTYTCLGGAQVVPMPIVTMADVAPSTWVTLTGNVTLPPAAAAAGCRLTEASVSLQQEAGTCGAAAGQIECPDLFVDDVSITVVQ